MVRAHLKQTDERKDATAARSSPPVAPPPPSPAAKKRADATTWPCKINGCNKVFAREADLKRHQRTTKSHSVPAFSCPQCDANFTRNDALKRHQKSRCVKSAIAAHAGSLEEFAAGRHHGVVIDPPNTTKARAASRQAESPAPVTRSPSATASEPPSAEEASSSKTRDAPRATPTPQAPRGNYYRSHTMLPTYGGGPSTPHSRTPSDTAPSPTKSASAPPTPHAGPSAPPPAAAGVYPVLPPYYAGAPAPGVLYAVPHFYAPPPPPPHAFYRAGPAAAAHAAAHVPPYALPPPPHHQHHQHQGPQEYVAHYPAAYVLPYPPGVFPPVLRPVGASAPAAGAHEDSASDEESEGEDEGMEGASVGDAGERDDDGAAEAEERQASPNSHLSEGQPECARQEGKSLAAEQPADEQADSRQSEGVGDAGQEGSAQLARP